MRDFLKIILLLILFVSNLAWATTCKESEIWPPKEVIQPYTYEYADALWWGGEGYNGWGQSGFNSAQEAWNWWLALHQQRYPTQTCSQIPHLGAGVDGFVTGWIQFLCREPSNGGEWGGHVGEPVHSYCPDGFSANLTAGTCEKRQSCPAGTVDVGSGCSVGKEDGICYYRVINGVVEKDSSDPDCLQATCCMTGQVIGASGNCINDCPPNLIMNHDDSCIGHDDKEMGEDCQKQAEPKWYEGGN